VRKTLRSWGSYYDICVIAGWQVRNFMRSWAGWYNQTRTVWCCRENGGWGNCMAKIGDKMAAEAKKLEARAHELVEDERDKRYNAELLVDQLDKNRVAGVYNIEQLQQELAPHIKAMVDRLAQIADRGKDRAALMAIRLTLEYVFGRPREAQNEKLERLIDAAEKALLNGGKQQ